MTTFAAIRTHRWGEDEERLAALLLPVFGDRLCVVFHNRPADLMPPLPVVDMTDAWVRANGLRVTHDYGWRCGDYAFYALRQARPGADHYWLVEPDVMFTGPVADFFAGMEDVAADALGVRFAEVSPQHRFARTMPPGMPLMRAIFALTRFSGRALDRLWTLRRAYSATRVMPRNFANDEIFAFSHLGVQPDMVLAAVADLAPDWFADTTVETDPDMLIDVLHGRTAPGVFHPVRARASFREAVAKRAAGQAHFFAAMRPSLAHLTDEDIAAIAADIGRRAAASLTHQRASAQAEEARTARLAGSRAAE